MFNKFKDDLMLSRYLDGEAGEGESAEVEKAFLENPALKEEALRLKKLKSELKEMGEDNVPRDLNALIMKRVVEEKPRNRFYTFLFRPRPIFLRTSVAAGLTAAAAAAVLVLLAFHVIRSDRSVEPGAPVAHGAGPRAEDEKLQDSSKQEEAQPDVRSVGFSVRLPEAGSVSLVGDFNEWSEDGIELRDDDSDGLWTVEIRIKPGRYQYMFVVNGKEWIVDEHADAVIDDGFGSLNSIRLVM
jgi:hypothetical protein